MVEKCLPLVVRLKNSTLIYLGVDEQDFLPYFYRTETKKSTFSLLPGRTVYPSATGGLPDREQCTSPTTFSALTYW